MDTEGTVSNVSDEFGMHSCLTTVCACIFVHPSRHNVLEYLEGLPGGLQLEQFVKTYKKEVKSYHRI